MLTWKLSCAVALICGLLSAPPVAAAATGGTPRLALAKVASSIGGTPGLALDKVALEAGRLVIEGTASKAGIVVKIYGTTFSDTSDAQRRFSFYVFHSTLNCRVILQTSTGRILLAVSNCSPQVMQRGVWSSTTQYFQNDLVQLDGSTYRAIWANLNREPTANPLNWQIFAARGAVGPTGAQGTAGAPGASGLDGSDGATGPAGTDGATGPAGTDGADGTDGAPGPAGTVLAFADFYAMMPVDNPATLAPGVAVSFPNIGPASASGISKFTPSEFNLSTPGVYLINFQVSVTEAGQLAVALDGIDLPTTVVGRATGASQIVGMSLIEVSVADTKIQIRNPAANAGVLTMTPYAGAASPVSAHLTILRLQ